MRSLATLAAVLFALSVAPSLHAQAKAPAAPAAPAVPETHVVTVTYVQMPFPVVRDFMDYADKYLVPRDKENPHVLSVKYLVHSWGAADQTLWVITEYKDMAGIQQGQQWDDEQLRKTQPDSTKRTAIRKEYDDKFAQYFAHHVDNILMGQVKRMKP